MNIIDEIRFQHSWKPECITEWEREEKEKQIEKKMMWTFVVLFLKWSCSIIGAKQRLKLNYVNKEGKSIRNSWTKTNKLSLMNSEKMFGRISIAVSSLTVAFVITTYAVRWCFLSLRRSVCLPACLPDCLQVMSFTSQVTRIEKKLWKKNNKISTRCQNWYVIITSTSFVSGIVPMSSSSLIFYEENSSLNEDEKKNKLQRTRLRYEWGMWQIFVIECEIREEAHLNTQTLSHTRTQGWIFVHSHSMSKRFLVLPWLVLSIL